MSVEVPKEHINMVKTDICRIDDALSQNNVDANWKLFQELDGRYQACIRDWYRGMWQSNHAGTMVYFPTLKQHPEQVKDNLAVIKAKLETYQFQVNAVAVPMAATQVNVTTNVNITLSFDEARQKIEDMTALNQAQTEEIIEKIDELEAISKEDTSRKKKWEKVKPILMFALDKGADIATAIMALVLQMKLGL